MDISRPVHHEPEFTFIQGQVITGIPNSMYHSGIHRSESIGYIISIREPEEIQSGIVLLVVAFVQNKKLGEQSLFTYCDIDTRKIRVPGGGFIFLAACRYGHDRHAENQQCTFFHF